MQFFKFITDYGNTIEMPNGQNGLLIALYLVISNINIRIKLKICTVNVIKINKSILPNVNFVDFDDF